MGSVAVGAGGRRRRRRRLLLLLTVRLEGVRVETQVGLRRQCCRRCCGRRSRRRCGRRLLRVRGASALAVSVHRWSWAQCHRIRLLNNPTIPSIFQIPNNNKNGRDPKWDPKWDRKSNRKLNIKWDGKLMDHLLESSVRDCGNPQRMQRGDWRWATTLKWASGRNWAVIANGCCCCCFRCHRFRRSCSRWSRKRRLRRLRLPRDSARSGGRLPQPERAIARAAVASVNCSDSPVRAESTGCWERGLRRKERRAATAAGRCAPRRPIPALAPQCPICSEGTGLSL